MKIIYLNSNLKLSISQNTKEVKYNVKLFELCYDMIPTFYYYDYASLKFM